MPCEEIKSEKYQTRKSPPFHAKDCKDLAKKGKDGTYISESDARGVYKWVKTGTRKAKGKAYFIHDNGSKPYKVQVSGNIVEIYKGKYRRDVLDTKSIDYETMDYDELVKKLTVKKVYLGKSPCIDAADLCGAKSLGNTILLHISGKKYIHIGYDIFEFTIDDEKRSVYLLNCVTDALKIVPRMDRQSNKLFISSFVNFINSCVSYDHDQFMSSLKVHRDKFKLSTQDQEEFKKLLKSIS
jgi:hypothetical protein